CRTLHVTPRPHPRSRPGTGQRGASQAGCMSDRHRRPTQVRHLLLAVALGVWPLAPAPTVWHEFEPPEERWSRGHRGVDLVGTVGQPVRAAVDGTVAFAGTVAGIPSVSVDHPDGTRTTYQPVLPAVAPGTVVRAGTPLGALVPTGSHCAPATCLHW